jgi:hypothetical protein
MTSPEKLPASVHTFHECVLGAAAELNRAHLGLDDIIETLQKHVLPWGHHLLLASSKYLVEGFTGVKKAGDKALLLGNTQFSQPDAIGFYATPRDLSVITSNNPRYTAVVIDNRAQGQSQYAHRSERLRFPRIDGQNALYADTARRPILIIPRESNYVHPDPRKSLLDSWRKEHCSRRKP